MSLSRAVSSAQLWVKRKVWQIEFHWNLSSVLLKNCNWIGVKERQESGGEPAREGEDWRRSSGLLTSTTFATLKQVHSKASDTATYAYAYARLVPTPHSTTLFSLFCSVLCAHHWLRTLLVANTRLSSQLLYNSRESSQLSERVRQRSCSPIPRKLREKSRRLEESERMIIKGQS